MSTAAAPANPWLSVEYVRDNWGDISEALGQHASLTLQTVAIALALALPLAVLARFSARAESPVVATTGVLYTIPSVALFGMLAPVTGIGRTTVLIGLVAYALLVIVRNTVVGLQSVPPDVLDAARGLGYGPARRLLSVELPLALPAVLAGLRLATVSTVAMVTVGVVVGFGGLGQLMFRGLQSNYRAEIVTAILLCLALALAADLVLWLLGRALMPWSRARSAA
jgi:osmoprotectant transport system permease protein